MCQLHQFPGRQPPIDPAMIDRRDARAVIAAIFQATQTIEQPLGHILTAKDSYDTAHTRLLPSLFRGLLGHHHLSKPFRPAGLAPPLGPDEGQGVRLDIAGYHRARADERPRTARARDDERVDASAEGTFPACPAGDQARPYSRVLAAV